MSDDTRSSASDFGTPFRALVDHCESHGLTFSASREKKRIKFTICREHALYRCNLRITHDDDVLQIYVHYPVLAKDEKTRPAAAELFTRANYNLVLGKFEMDMSDGEIRYHVGHLIAGGKLEDSTIGCLVSTALSTADQYFPAFMRLLFGGNTAEDAVYLAELEMHSESLGDGAAAPGASSGGKTNRA